MANPNRPSVVFIPGSWHKPSCYNKVIKLLQEENGIKCCPVTLPSTTGDPNATFKDDIDAAHKAVVAETSQGRNVIVVAHSYGGMVGNSVIRGLTRSKASSSASSASNQATTEAGSQDSKQGYIVGLVLIASGFTLTGLAFMDPFFGIPPPSWRVNKESGFAELTANPRDLFYHDVAEDEANYWVSQLTTQSLKSLFEGGEHAYAGWQDVPNWYIGTSEDRGLPVVVQRMQVGMVRGHGRKVEHIELKSSHSPFLSLPEEVAGIIMDAVKATSGEERVVEIASEGSVEKRKIREGYEATSVRLSAPGSWFRLGIPLFVGRMLGWGVWGFLGLRRFWKRT